ncbi:MAG: hypothetical protein OXD48_02730, partial [Litoreibacter sp.]|nr:hypothetical protein [Litoreibacter sp.]
MLAQASKIPQSPDLQAVRSAAGHTKEQDGSTLSSLQALADSSVPTKQLLSLTDATAPQTRASQSQTSKTAQFANTTTLQRGPAPSGQVQSPALIGARNTPVQSAELDSMGISATQMSDDNYAAWKASPQSKLGLHGAYSNAGVTTVTQLKNSGVLQGWFLKPSHKAILLIFEGILTLAAGGVALGFAISVGAIPAIVGAVMGIGVGALKIARAGLMLWPIKKSLSVEEKAAIKAKRANWINLIRGVESALAMVGAAMVMTDPTRLASGVSLAIFAVAKAVRSIATHMARNDAKGVPSRAAKVAAVAHIIETAALAVAGGMTIESGIEVASNPRIGAGAIMEAVATSKAVRTTDQVKDAFFPETQAAAGGGGPAPNVAAPAAGGQPPGPPNNQAPGLIQGPALPPTAITLEQIAELPSPPNTPVRIAPQPEQVGPAPQPITLEQIAELPSPPNTPVRIAPQPEQ